MTRGIYGRPGGQLAITVVLPNPVASFNAMRSRAGLARSLAPLM
jgi:hypothetical protein